MPRSRTIVVAGAGIGGLTAALALAAKGFRIIVIEKAERLEETGAGLQLSPNASRILIDLGLQSRLASRVLIPDAISIMSARTGHEITSLPLGGAAALRTGAPYWVMHRAGLQAALLEHVRDHPDIDLRLGVQFEDAADDASGVIVGMSTGASRQQENALALIGADGVWSTVRQQLFPAVHPQFSGMTAWRGTIDTTGLPRETTARRVRLWLGSDAHLVAYPISGGRQINIVAILPGTRDEPRGSTPVEAAEIASRFATARWPEAARTMIGAVDAWRKWPLFTIAPLAAWHSGSIALLGDAAHAMLPFAAQGAGMAIEDAAVIAKCLGGSLGENTDGIAAALARYTASRRARVTRVQRLAERNGQIYHLRPPVALARDLVMKTMGARRLMARQDWIYDWRL